MPSAKGPAAIFRSESLSPAQMTRQTPGPPLNRAECELMKVNIAASCRFEERPASCGAQCNRPAAAAAAAAGWPVFAP